jgi:hypothetical protein
MEEASSVRKHNFEAAAAAHLASLHLADLLADRKERLDEAVKLRLRSFRAAVLT